MKRITTIAVLTAVLAVSVAQAAGTHTVGLAHTSAGKLLVASNGFTLYQFSKDGRNHDACVKISGCASVWPPYTVKGKPSAGSGVKASDLGTIAIGGGKHQVTYFGHPLYEYSGDSSPAATDYLNTPAEGGVWTGVSASGGKVK
jgi:predicted lipoprotein with Yx(FWY)xxD motif